MPELPEVEIMAQNLDRWLVGDRIGSIDIRDGKLAGNGLSGLVGAKVVRAWRRAKYALVDVDCGKTLVVHYRMTGKTVLDPRKQRRARVRLEMASGTRVAFEDPRRLGELFVLDTAAVDGFIAGKSLGPEPWPQRRDGGWWSRAMTGLRGPIKTAMMKQDRVAGIGNILASESLFMAQVDPRLATNALSDDQWDRLADAVHAVIQRTLDAESGDEIAYVNAGGEGSFLVYGHAGTPCPRCTATIVRFVQAGRSTFYCPECVSDAK
ncbi:MAG: DNA-formamidopyrimidine glycosylase family protein [Myxococcota bacterium]|nr:DNA-formamidopyrimidine glycosylase family protein [Myxococcota bacterium]